MNDKYKLIGEKGPELNDTDLTFLNRNPVEYYLKSVRFIDYILDETRPMKVEIEVRKFGLWWKL